MRVARIIFTLVLILAISNYSGTSDSSATHRFSVPPKLRARVDFWISVFSKYGKHHTIIHHRQYPQIVFEVVDLSIEGTFLTEAQFARLKKIRVDRSLGLIRSALKWLAEGNDPRNKLERYIEQKMEKFLGLGLEKYRDLLKEDAIRTQTGIREMYAEAIKRSGRYIHTMETIFAGHGLPVELTRLPFIESSFNYTAYSSVGAAGIWQFMRRTAQSYMTINRIVDQRRDPIIATHAAAKYLKVAYSELGSWPLAITSYNHGVGGVRRKMNSSRFRNIEDLIEHPSNSFGFASSNFYPEFLAAVEVYRRRSELFPEVTPEQSERYIERRVPRAMTMPAIAKYFGVPENHLRAINYSFAREVWNGRYSVPAGYVIKIPTGQVSLLPEQQAESPVVVAAPVIKTPGSYSVVYGGTISHVVRRGESLSIIAARHGVTVNEIRRLNGLRSTTVRVGQTLKIKTTAKATSATRAPQAAVVKAPATVATTVYKVRRGDTLSTIANRFRVSVTTLRTLNRKSSNRIVVGEALRIPGSVTSVAPTAAKPRFYKVRPGDSLWLVAKRNQVSVTSIIRLNGLRSKNLKVGQTLKVSP